MSDIRYVCLSDTHFGEEDSLLTNLKTASTNPDPNQPSQTLPKRNMRLSPDTVVCYWSPEPKGDGFCNAFSGLLYADLNWAFLVPRSAMEDFHLRVHRANHLRCRLWQKCLRLRRGNEPRSTFRFHQE